MLFIPGSNAAMLSTAFVYRPDSIMFDLEDAVSLRAKDSARMLVYHALQLPMYREMETVVRINPLDTPFGHKDLEAAVRGGAEIIRLPKTDCAEDVLRLEREVERIEKECGRKAGSTRLMAAIESASGVVNALSIATSTPRMDSIALAGFDYVVDMQTQRGDGMELFYARCAVLHAARAAKIDAFDVVFSDVNDDEGFLKESNAWASTASPSSIPARSSFSIRPICLPRRKWPRQKELWKPRWKPSAQGTVWSP
jgi:citrate lyase subunit beta/citryl-CoA lyase